MSAGSLLIGGGPSGLAGAYCLGQEGVDYDWVDREGLAGGAYRRVNPDIVLASPTRYTSLPGLASESSGEYITAGEYGTYLERYCAVHRLRPQKAEVEGMDRRGEGFQVRFSGGREEAYDTVVVATGMFDHPALPSFPGLAPTGGLEVMHAGRWPGSRALAGKRVLVIGGATSGVEIAEDCARAGLLVTVSARGGKPHTTPQRILGRDVHDYAVWVERLPAWVLPQYCRGKTLPGTDLGFWRYIREGKITLSPEVERFTGARAFFRGGGSDEFDAVILATGYRFETPFLPESLERTKKRHPFIEDGESRDWPGLFFLGFPCTRGLDSQFLRGVAKDAPVLARRLKERTNA